MTALTQFLRLEASGVWRASAERPERDVIVSLGDATLVICDSRGDAIAHWALSAVTRANPGATPACYHPDGDPDQTLTLPDDETEMIAGIDRVLQALRRPTPTRGKMRWALLPVVLGLMGWSVVALPGTLREAAARSVPAVKRGEIGAHLLTRITEATGTPCRAPQGRAAMRRLITQVTAPEPAPRVVVLPNSATQSAHLPGRIVLLSSALILSAEDPGVAAMHLAAEAAAARAHDPLLAMLDDMSLWQSLHLLAMGEISTAALDGYAAQRMDQPAAPTGDPLPVLTGFSDADWVRLQGICDEA